jgi:hypothetical protein
VVTLLFLLFGACPSLWAAVWEEHRLGAADSVRIVEIELYRGIVRFHALPRAEAVTLKAALAPYDDHRPGAPIDASIRQLPEGALVLSSADGTSRIAAPTLRDLVVVDVTAPADTPVRIQIVHYGEVTVEDAKGDVEVNLFQGAVDLRRIRGPALVHIVRDGAIRARLEPPVAERAMAFTTYDGDILLELPETEAGRLRVASVRGTIHNQLPTPADGRPHPGEPILVRNAKGTIDVLPLR